ncbi:YbaN family protein [Pacificibacter marinus]|uniref:YbaN family protein n=1 Tax=Pacificibacter marinus TaxID=658057 RepID=UPI001C07E50C|nr:YbaN family protein [Pacificibacter marinus]MBU2868534.1 YbaN family protein [Pacificibacter marinus]
MDPINAVPNLNNATIKYIHLALGWLCVVLGLIGAVLPILPTTVFFILAAFFFTKGSPRLRHWLISHPTVGPAIQNWEDTGSIAPRIKMVALTMMGVTLAISLVFAMPLKIIMIQGLCMSAAALYILTRPNR